MSMVSFMYLLCPWPWEKYVDSVFIGPLLTVDTTCTVTPLGLAIRLRYLKAPLYTVNKAAGGVVSSYLNDTYSEDVNTLFKICTEGMDIPLTGLRFQAMFMFQKCLSCTCFILYPSRNIWQLTVNEL